MSLRRRLAFAALIALGLIGLVPGAASAHLPFIANPQEGCVLPAGTEQFNPTAPYGPVDGSGVIAPHASVNTCGSK